MLRGLLSFSSMTMISRVLGLVRDLVITTTFGTNAVTDAFWVAFRVPNFLRRLFAEGSFATAFVPVFTEVKETRSHAELRELMSRVAGTLGGVLLLVTALALIFAPQLATLFSSGVDTDPAKHGLLVDLFRLTFPFLLFVSLTALAGGALNSFQRFAMPALTPVILNLCMIAGALWLAPRLGGTPEKQILALGWAVLAAGILQLLFQLPSLKGINLLTLPRWGWRHPGVRKVLTLMVRGIALGQVGQSNARILLWKEARVALINGTLIGLLVGLIAFVWFHSMLLSLVITLALIINFLAAALAGVLLPLLLKRMNVDPAVAGTVVVTAGTDVMGFFSFLGLATLILLH